MKESISGEFQVQNLPSREEEPEIPKVIAEGAVEVEGQKIPEASKEAKVIDTDKLINDLADLDGKIKPIYTKLRTYTDLTEKFASNKDLAAKLNEESKQFQAMYEQLQAKRDHLAAQLRQE